MDNEQPMENDPLVRLYALRDLPPSSLLHTLTHQFSQPEPFPHLFHFVLAAIFLLVLFLPLSVADPFFFPLPSI